LFKVGEKVLSEGMIEKQLFFHFNPNQVVNVSGHSINGLFRPVMMLSCSPTRSTNEEETTSGSASSATAAAATPTRAAMSPTAATTSVEMTLTNVVEKKKLDGESPEILNPFESIKSIKQLL